MKSDMTAKERKRRGKFMGERCTFIGKKRGGISRILQKSPSAGGKSRREEFGLGTGEKRKGGDGERT